MKVERISIEALRKQSQSLGDLRTILADSYANPDEVLRSSMDDADMAYLGLDTEGRTCCFFLASPTSVSINAAGCVVEAAYLGLSAARQASKGTGQVIRLYRAFLEDLTQAPPERGVVLWAMTASPSTFSTVQRLFVDVSPRPDGTFSADDEALAKALEGQVGRPAEPDHPFVFRELRSNRYTVAERGRLQRLAGRKEFDLFERLRVDESRGDRLLMVFRAPPRPPTGTRHPG